MMSVRVSLIFGRRINRCRPLCLIREIASNSNGGNSNSSNNSKVSLEELLLTIKKVNPENWASDRAGASKVAKFSPVEFAPEKDGKQPSTGTASTAAHASAAHKNNIESEISEAARDVAATLPGNPDVTVNELLSALNGSPPANATKPDIQSLLSSMSVVQDDVDTNIPTRPDGVMRANYFRPSTHTKQPIAKLPKRNPRTYSTEHVEIDGGNPLNIFPVASQAEQPSADNESGGGICWSYLLQRELNLNSTRPPRTAWEEMARWTEQGLLWPLPVDNELGKLEDASVGFEDHIFLERYIESWCPKSGPIRKFMALVCSSLSNNFRFSAQEKRDHLEWFREYFGKKESLLKELDCL